MKIWKNWRYPLHCLYMWREAPESSYKMVNRSKLGFSLKSYKICSLIIFSVKWLTKTWNVWQRIPALSDKMSCKLRKVFWKPDIHGMKKKQLTVSSKIRPNKKKCRVSTNGTKIYRVDQSIFLSEPLNVHASLLSGTPGLSMQYILKRF